MADELRERADKEVSRLPADVQEIVWLAAAAVPVARMVLGHPSPTLFQNDANALAIELAHFLRGRVKGPKG
jgi:hypothetical protein